MDLANTHHRRSPASRPAALAPRQYNPNFVEQVLAMETRAAQLGHPREVFYMFPDNGGMSAADQAKAVAAGLPASPPMNSYTDQPPTSAGPYFYRIRVQSP